MLVECLLSMTFLRELFTTECMHVFHKCCLVGRCRLTSA